MRITGVRRRAGAISPVALLLAFLAAVLALASIWIDGHTSRWHAQLLAEREEFLAAGASIVEQVAAHLSKADWEFRYYAAGAAPGPASTVEEGTFEGTDFLAVVKDAVDTETHQPVWGRTRIFLRLTRGAQRQGLTAQLRWRRPTVVLPAAVTTERLFLVTQDMATREGREAVEAVLDADDAARENARSSDEVLIREIARIHADPAKPSPAAVVAAVLKLDLSARVGLERPVTEALRAGARAFANGGREGQLAAARTSYEAALAAAGLQTDPSDRAVGTSRAGYGLGLTLLEQAQATRLDAAGRVERGKLLDLADDVLAKAMAARADGPLASYIVPARARAEWMRSPGPDGRAAARKTLDAVIPGYALMYPFGACRPLDGSVARNGALDLEKMLIADTFPAVAGTSPFPIVAVRDASAKGRAIPLTLSSIGPGAPLPAAPDKDLVTPSADGLKIAFRLHRVQGGKVLERIYTMDFDGAQVRDVSQSDPADAAQGWRPPWFARWRQDAASIPFPTAQPLLADCVKASTPAAAAAALAQALDALAGAKGGPAAAKPLAAALRKSPSALPKDPAIDPHAATGALADAVALANAACVELGKGQAPGPDQPSHLWNAWRASRLLGRLAEATPTIDPPVFAPETGLPDPDARERQKQSGGPANAGPDRDRDDR